ncbi:uncharacterized protein LOC134277737 isoform X1 [Saccostrea cucullata]|uniref:uncharacterized protein LOC134277737 isoform X1 n=1 Tax=Saccostrea cuccullata TaxID=36930 RepID=UPI002ED11F6C
MASRPKRRRTKPSSTDNQSTQPDNDSTQLKNLVTECMAAALPIIEKTVKECMSKLNTAQPAASQQPATTGQPEDRSDEVSNTSTFNTIVNNQDTTTDTKIQGTLSQHGYGRNDGSAQAPTPLIRTADFLIRNSLSEDSLSSYKNIFATYKRFIHAHVDRNADPLPPSLSHLLLYIAHCYQLGLAASTTRTHIAALSFTFQLGGYQDLTQSFLIKKQLQGFSKVKPSIDNRLPITPDILSKVVAALPSITTCAFNSTLLHAMFVLAFCAFLRVGEITKTAGAKQHYLLAEHVTFQKDSVTGNSINLTIPHFKHSNQSTTLHIQQNMANPLLCPFLVLQAFMNIRGHSSPAEPLFSFMDGSPVSRQFFTEHLKLSLTFCGLDINKYQSHSFRIGAATTAAASGSSDIQIQNMGRWKSSAFKKYIRIPTMKI